MAKKTVVICDSCGATIEEGQGSELRVTFADPKRGAKAADLCDTCSVEMPGVLVARRGRKPKAG